MSIETVIFLGGGASTAEGAPTQSELFRQYFGSKAYKASDTNMDRNLATFFSQMFGIDVDNVPARSIPFPTFEEVLGLTDLGLLRKESFKYFDLENAASNSGRLRSIQQSLIFLVAKILDQKLGEPRGFHRQLVDRLWRAGKLLNTAFISTNYDILIDNALTELHERRIDLDYGIDFRNFERPGDWERPNPSCRVLLFKPHGSLNWLFCPTCNQIEITPKEKGVVTHLITDFKGAPCRACESVYAPVIVPPTFYKDLTNVFLATIWNKAEKVLREASTVIFCGYSLPDADMHIKYLLKRAQTNRSGNDLDFIVFNHHRGKKAQISKDEKDRYQRFLGRQVRYTSLSFEDFVDDPLIHMPDTSVGVRERT
jgi:hypothetical protein